MRKSLLTFRLPTHHTPGALKYTLPVPKGPSLFVPTKLTPQVSRCRPSLISTFYASRPSLPPTWAQLNHREPFLCPTCTALIPLHQKMLLPITPLLRGSFSILEPNSEPGPRWRHSESVGLVQELQSWCFPGFGHIQAQITELVSLQESPRIDCSRSDSFSSGSCICYFARCGFISQTQADNKWLESSRNQGLPRPAPSIFLSKTEQSENRKWSLFSRPLWAFVDYCNEKHREMRPQTKSYSLLIWSFGQTLVFPEDTGSVDMRTRERGFAQTGGHALKG
jgi:hypothetical protein